jgi:hypothetical protein
MNLRKVTIWTTGAMLIGTVVVSFSVAFLLENFTNKVGHAVFIWFLNGLPVLVSFFVAREIKFEIPAVILLVSAIAYGLLYVLGLCGNIFDPGNLGNVLWFYLGIWTFPIAFPTWILVLRLNTYYIKRVAHPGTAAAPSSPAPFESLEENHDE